MQAAMNGFKDSTTELLAHGADTTITNNYGNTALHQAAYYGHAAIAQKLISSGADIDAQTSLGTTPLIDACTWSGMHENSDAIKVLIENGADLNLKDSYGKSALWWA